MNPAPIIVGLALREDDAAPLALGVALSRLTGAPLALVSAHLEDVLHAAPPPHRDRPLVRDVLPLLEDHAAALRDEHRVSVHARRGSPSRVLHETAEELEAVVIVVGSSHRGRAGRVLGGSVTAGLLSGATAAVAVAPRNYEEHQGFRRIGVAYDGSEESREALGAAMALAFFAEGKVRAFTVLEPFSWIPGIAAAEAGTALDYEPLRRARTEEIAAEVLGLAPEGVAVTSEVVTGAPTDRLTALSRELDLLLCGSRGYGPMRSVLVGGVSRTLVNRAHCPVLVLPRPPARHHWLGHHRSGAESAAVAPPTP